MIGLLTTIVGAFIGAGLAPFIINFFEKRNKRLDKLREAYRLSEMVFQYFRSVNSSNQMVISLLEKRKEWSPRWDEFIEKSYPTINPLQEFIVLLDFDLEYQEDKIRTFESICVDINCITANLRAYFFNKQYDDVKVLEQKNKNLIKNIILFSNEIRSWCKAEKDTKISYVVLDWCRKVKISKTFRQKK